MREVLRRLFKCLTLLDKQATHPFLSVHEDYGECVRKEFTMALTQPL